MCLGYWWHMETAKLYVIVCCNKVQISGNPILFWNSFQAANLQTARRFYWTYKMDFVKEINCLEKQNRFLGNMATSKSLWLSLKALFPTVCASDGKT